MKVCITAVGQGLEAPVDLRFGRCPFFVVVDTDSMSAEAIPNPSANAAGGAGIGAAQAVARLGVASLITGNIGPNALQTLTAAGIDVYQSQGKTVKDAVEMFKKEDLVKMASPSVPPHGGMGRGGGQGGMGRGRRGGGPGGKGQGGGRGGW